MKMRVLAFFLVTFLVNAYAENTVQDWWKVRLPNLEIVTVSIASQTPLAGDVGRPLNSHGRCT